MAVQRLSVPAPAPPAQPAPIKMKRPPTKKPGVLKRMWQSAKEHPFATGTAVAGGTYMALRRPGFRKKIFQAESDPWKSKYMKYDPSLKTERQAFWKKSKVGMLDVNKPRAMEKTLKETRGKKKVYLHSGVMTKAERKTLEGVGKRTKTEFMFVNQKDAKKLDLKMEMLKDVPEKYRGKVLRKLEAKDLADKKSRLFVKRKDAGASSGAGIQSPIKHLTPKEKRRLLSSAKSKRGQYMVMESRKGKTEFRIHTHGGKVLGGLLEGPSSRRGRAGSLTQRVKGSLAARKASKEILKKNPGMKDRVLAFDIGVDKKGKPFIYEAQDQSGFLTEVKGSRTALHMKHKLQKVTSPGKALAGSYYVGLGTTLALPNQNQKKTS